MAKNVGKLFEEDFKNSCEKESNLFWLRLIDSTASWDKHSTTFQPKNISDFIMFNGKNMFILELKSYQDKTITKSKLQSSHQKIKQYDGLLNARNKYQMEDLIVGYIFNMRLYDETYFIDIDDIEYHFQNNRLGIDIDKMREIGKQIDYIIPRKRHRYYINDFLDKFD